MILTVTLNPAWDVTYDLTGPLAPGSVQRVGTVTQRPGGKGVNVAAVLSQLGAEVTATGLADATFNAAVAELGIRADFAPLLPSVRRTLAVVDPATTTSLWEPGAPAPLGAAEAVSERIAANPAGVLVISGSLPPGMPDSLPATLAGAAIDRGARVIVDTSGPALAAAAEVPGVIVMPNRDELAELVHAPVRDLATARSAASALARRGVTVLATLGTAGLILATESAAWHLPVPEEIHGNPTGAGDATAAALAIGLNASSLLDAARSAVAMGAAAVAAPVAGVVDLDLYRRLRPLVTPIVLEGTR